LPGFFYWMQQQIIFHNAVTAPDQTATTQTSSTNHDIRSTYTDR
jgi:hypothetical protein